MEKTYDELCEDASAAAETRLLDHFKQHGGEVWAIGAGCQSCRQKLADTSGLKKCSNCDAALFCGRDCQLKAWPSHKAECGVISTFRRVRKTALSASQLKEKLEALSWTTNAKRPEEPTVAGIAASIGMATAVLPGWFFTLDFALESKERQKALYQAALELYGLLIDEECWTRDKDSFPRSSYTLVDSLPHGSPRSEHSQSDFVAMNGHLLLFSAWLQHPEPPATQALPFEARSFFGVVDSLLQISALRDGVDAFMDARSS